MNWATRFVILLAAACATSSVAVAVDTTILHSFTGQPDGRNSYGSPTLVGSTLYGWAGGGSNDLGMIFSIDTDGSDYRVLRSITNTTTEGSSSKWGRPTVSGSTLYALTESGGAHNRGTIYQMSTDGSSLNLLYSFNSSGSSGYSPSGTLVLDGQNLYGTAFYGGGTGKKGTVFKIGTNGTGFSVLHSFAGGIGDGDSPKSLVISNSTLYGMTYAGGASAYGTIYKINTDGTGFQILHSFTGGSGGGCGAQESLTGIVWESMSVR